MNLDINVINFMSEIKCVPLDYFFKFFTHLGDFGFLYILIGILFLFFKKTRKTGAIILLSLIFCGILGNLILKPIIARIRPYDRLNLPLKIKPLTDFSFPSGHTYGAFAVAGSIHFTKVFKSLPFFIVAAIISASRIYFTVHYPSDVAFGVVMGMILSYVSNKIVNKFYNSN